MTKSAPGAAGSANPALQRVKAAGRSPNDLIRELVESARLAAGIRSRKALAERLALTPRSLRNWLVEPSELSGEQIEKLVKALELGPEKRDALYRLTGQVPPAPSASALKRTPEMAVYQEMLDGLEHPSVVYSECWDVVITNQSFRDVFGGVRRHMTAHPLRNTQRYIFFHPDASQLLGAGDLTNFRDHWLMPALAHFSATLQQRPEEPRLRAIERDIDERPALRRAYRRAPQWIAEYGDIAIGPSARLFWDPRVRRVVNAHLITEAHQGYQETTLQRATFILRECRPRPVSPYEQRALFELEAADHAVNAGSTP